jgi:hypothetical protein
MVAPNSIVDDGYKFHGSFAELCQIYSHWKGDWSDYGSAKKFDPDPDKTNGSLTTIVWWPDTGDVLHRALGKTIDDQVYFSNDLFENNCERYPGEWSLISEGNFKGMSLPQLFFKDPLEFVRDEQEDGGYFEGKEKIEAREIVAKARQILIPDGNECGRCAVHQFVLKPNDEYTYLGVHIEGAIIQRACGYQVVAEQIDMTTPYNLDVEGAKSSKNAVRSLMKVLGKPQSRFWDKKACEDFFDNKFDSFPGIKKVS